MKVFKSITSVLLAAMIVSGGVATASASQAETSITQEDSLTCFGSLLKNKRGETVTLRGTNFGGWLVYEQWMCGCNGADAGVELLTKLEKRFGKERAQELIDTYQDNFITENDLDNLKEYGFNCVRVPFWYRTLQTDENGTWKLNEKGEIDFSRLDWVVEQCGKRGIYVILDMHGLPGFQSAAHHSGAINSSKLYDDTPEGEEFRRRSVELWEKVAQHFVGNPVVAAYDLMNEPMCDFTDAQKDDMTMWKMYDLLYDAVRAIDTEHVITMEAIWSFGNLPVPEQFGWKNVMYQMHLYNSKTSDYSYAMKECRMKMHGVPVYVGEFHPSSDQAPWEEILQAFNDSGASWTTWTYKGHCKWGDSSDWFMMGVSGSECIVDIDNDSFETIKSKWGESLRTENSYRQMGPIELFTNAAEQKPENNLCKNIKATFEVLFKHVRRAYYVVFGLFE